MDALEVCVTDRTGRLTAGARESLALHWRKCFEYMGLKGSVRCCIVDDAAMAALHERYGGVAGTTDVLTFDLNAWPENTGVRPESLSDDSVVERIRLGVDTDIFVCLDEAHRQAASRGYSVERELLLYGVHGVLHCLGWDDHTEAGSRAMHGLEDEVLRAVGVGDVYGTFEAWGE